MEEGLSYELEGAERSVRTVVAQFSRLLEIKNEFLNKSDTLSENEENKESE